MAKQLIGRIRKLANYQGFIVGISDTEGAGYETYLVDWEEHAIDDLIYMMEGDVEDVELATAWIGATLGIEGLEPPKRVYRDFGLMVKDRTVTAHFKPNL